MLKKLGITLAGAAFGFSLTIGYIAQSKAAVLTGLTVGSVILLASISAIIFLTVFLLAQIAIRKIVLAHIIPAQFHARYKSLDTITYFSFVLIAFGSVGLFIPFSFLFLLFVLSQLAVISLSVSKSENTTFFTSIGWLTTLFFVSGFAALIYQIAWQRVLFSIYGLNIESITIVVSIFMLGLGVGSILGGRLSTLNIDRLPYLFFTIEILIGLFGLFSIYLIYGVGTIFMNSSLVVTSLSIYALLFIPTTLMGATLPVLVTYINSKQHDVGRSVGMLYGINTLGSALACFITADVLFSIFGLQNSIIIAACCNILVGVLVYIYSKSITLHNERLKPA